MKLSLTLFFLFFSITAVVESKDKKEKNKHIVFITVDYLYWQVQEDGLAFGTDISLNSVTGEKKGKVQNLNFEWNSGFRIGIGYRMTHDRWELFTNLTRISGNADANISTTTNLLYPEWATIVEPVSPNNLVTYLDGRWDYSLNILDGEIARTIKETKRLSFKPHVGIRGAWINQKYKTNLCGGLDGATTIFADNIEMTNHFQGVGFRAAMDTDWTMWKHFSIFGNVGGSLLYGNFYIRRVEKQSTSNQIALSTAIDILDEFHRVVPTMDIMLGLRFHYAFTSRAALSLQAGWEFNDFFGQNKLEHLKTAENSTYSFIANDSDLTTQGLTFSVRLEF